MTAKIYEGNLEKFPKAVLINANNKGYCRVLFDESSKVFFLQNLSKVKSNLNRSYLWRALYD